MRALGLALSFNAKLLLMLQYLLLILLLILSSTKVWAKVGLIDIVSILMMICKTVANEILAVICDWWFGREIHLACIKDCLVF